MLLESLFFITDLSAFQLMLVFSIIAALISLSIPYNEWRLKTAENFNAEVTHHGIRSAVSFDYSQNKIAYSDFFLRRAIVFDASDLTLSFVTNGLWSDKSIPNTRYLRWPTMVYRCPEMIMGFLTRRQLEKLRISIELFRRNLELRESNIKLNLNFNNGNNLPKAHNKSLPKCDITESINIVVQPYNENVKNMPKHQIRRLFDDAVDDLFNNQLKFTGTNKYDGYQRLMLDELYKVFGEDALGYTMLSRGSMRETISRRNREREASETAQKQKTAD